MTSMASIRWTLLVGLVATVAQPSYGQQTIKLTNPCINVFSPAAQFPLEFKIINPQFGDSTEAQKRQVKTLDDIARSVLSTVGLTRDIRIYPVVDVPNACATMDSERRRVIYISGEWLDGYVEGNNWSRVAVIAHEVGHHLNNHTLEDGLGHWQREYEADKFAGRVVRLLGGSLADALKSVQKQPPIGTITHPARAVRVAAVSEGYGESTNVPAMDIPSVLRTRPTAETSPVYSSDPHAAPSVIQGHIAFLFSPEREQRLFAFSNLQASSSRNPAVLEQMSRLARQQPDNKWGVINVLNFMKLADKTALRAASGAVLELLNDPAIIDNGPQTRELIDEVRSRLG